MSLHHLPSGHIHWGADRPLYRPCFDQTLKTGLEIRGRGPTVVTVCVSLGKAWHLPEPVSGSWSEPSTQRCWEETMGPAQRSRGPAPQQLLVWLCCGPLRGRQVRAWASQAGHMVTGPGKLKPAS